MIASHETNLDGVQAACDEIVAGRVTGRYIVNLKN